jgi:hypothetical protein
MTVAICKPELVPGYTVDFYIRVYPVALSKRAKLFQLFIEKRVVTINATINDEIYKHTRIGIVLSIFVHQSFEICDF